MKNIIQLPKFLRKSSPVFKHFPQLDEVYFGGTLFNLPLIHRNDIGKERVNHDKVMVFSTQEQSQKGEMLMMSLIRQDEAELWQAFRELIVNILYSVEPKIVGIFRFQLLSIAMSEDLEKFQWKEFSQGMRDLAREIPVGESRFVQYCSLLGVLTKHAYEDESKIQFDPHVQVLDEAPEELDIALERLIKLDRKDAALSAKRKFIFYDLSRQPLYDRLNQEQDKRLQKLGRKLEALPATGLSEIFVIDQKGCHSLFTKAQFEMELF